MAAQARDGGAGVRDRQPGRQPTPDGDATCLRTGGLRQRIRQLAGCPTRLSRCRRAAVPRERVKSAPKARRHMEPDPAERDALYRHHDLAS